jgi:hypothetical protein
VRGERKRETERDREMVDGEERRESRDRGEERRESRDRGYEPFTHSIF